VTATDMPRGQPAVIVATAAFLLRLEKTFVRPTTGDFIKARQRLKPLRRVSGRNSLSAIVKSRFDLSRLPSRSRSLSSSAAVAQAAAHAFSFPA
jgi:hypothetical protein